MPLGGRPVPGIRKVLKWVGREVRKKEREEEREERREEKQSKG